MNWVMNWVSLERTIGVGTLTSARGAKREMVQNAIQRLPARFGMGDVQRACPGGVSYPTVKRALADLKREGRFRCLGKGRAAIVPAGVGEAGATGSEKGTEKILCSFGGIQRVSARGIADALGLTSRAVEKHLSKLKQEGRLKRIGPDKGGTER